MARGKDSIQTLLNKGKTADEIVSSGKYSQEEVNAYLNSSEIEPGADEDAGEEESGSHEEFRDGLEPEKEDSDVDSNLLDEATEIKPEDVEEVIEDKATNLFAGKTKSETERAYTKVNNGKVVDEVPEVFTRPQHRSEDIPPGGGTGTGATAQQPANPKLASATADQKRIAAEKLYDIVIVPAYKKLCEFLPLIARFGDRRLRKLLAKDEISLTTPLTWIDEEGNLQSQTLKQLIEDHNKACDAAFGYDEKFVTDAREPSIREFIKRGWGIAEEDELFWVLGAKVLDLTQSTIMLTMTKFDILAEAKTLHLENKKEGKEKEPVKQQATVTPDPVFTNSTSTHQPMTETSTIEEAVVIEETKHDGGN